MRFLEQAFVENQIGFDPFLRRLLAMVNRDVAEGRFTSRGKTGGFQITQLEAEISRMKEEEAKLG